MTARSEILMPGQELAISDTLDPMPLEVFVNDQASVKAALGWGLKVQDPIIKKLSGTTVSVRSEASSLVVFQKYIFPADTTLGLVIRNNADIDKNTKKLLLTSKQVLESARDENSARILHANVVSVANATYETKQRRNITSKIIGVIGGIALFGGLSLANDAMRLVAYQTNPVMFTVVSAGFIGSGLVGGVLRTRKLKSIKQSMIESSENPDSRSDAEELFGKLKQLLEKSMEPHDTKSTQPDDVIVLGQGYEMNFEDVERRLKQPGGPDYDDYKAVIEDLQMSLRPARGKSKAEEYSYVPASIIKNMLTESRGGVWGNEFEACVRALGVAQVELSSRGVELRGLPSTARTAPGISRDEREKKLKRQIDALENTIELNMLRIYRLNAAYTESRMASTEDVPDPYVAYSEPKGVIGRSETDPPEPNDGEWPLLKNNRPHQT